MKLIVNSLNVNLNEYDKKHIERRLHFTFSRYQDAIERMTIILKDVNGPKGGDDKQCKVIIHLAGQQELIITDRQSKLQHAIDRALVRASYNLQQRLKRRHQSFQKIHSTRESNNG